MKKYLTILICLSLLAISSPVLAETRTFIKEYTYQASEFDSKASGRILALEQVKRLLLEELGTYLISETEVKDFQMTKDQIMLFTAGSVRADVLDEKWDGKTYYLKVKLSADPEEVAQSVKRLSQDKKITNELEGTKKRADDLEKEVIRLRQELTTKADSVKIKQYSDTVNKLSAIEWMQKGFGLLKDGKDADKNKEALKAFNKAIELSPEDSDLYFLRAMVFYNFLGSNDYKNMLSDIDKAIGLHPSNKDNSAYKTTAPHLSMKAKIYKDKGDWRKSIQMLENAINLDANDAIRPSDPNPDKQRTVKEWLKKDFDEIIKKYPKDYRGYLFRGLYYDYFTKFDGKNYAAAIRDYRKAISLNPKSALCHYLLGETISRKVWWNPKIKTVEDYRKENKAAMAGLSVYSVYPQDYKDIIAELSEAIRLQPQMVKAYRERAQVYLTAKEDKLAIKDYDKLVELDPDYAGTYHDRAIAYKELGQYEEAIIDLTKAIKLKHSTFDWPRSAYEVRAHVYEAMERYGDAIDDYTKALEIEEKNLKTLNAFTEGKWLCGGIAYDLYDKRAFAYKKIGKYESAIVDFTKAKDCVGEGPGQHIPYGNRADVYMEMENPGEALKDYTKAIESNLKHNRDWVRDKTDTVSSEYFVKKAKAYATLEKFDLAVESYNKALDAVDNLPPFKGKIYQEMGMLYRSLGINHEAIKVFSLAVKYLPVAGEEPYLAYMELGNAYSDIGDHKEALRVFTEMLKIYPKWSLGYARRGYKYYEIQDYNRAILDFNRAIELMPTNAFFYYFRGLAFIDNSQFKQGIDDLKIAARLGHKEAQEKLNDLKIEW